MSDDDTEQDWGSPEDWNAVVEWWRRSQHPNTYYVQPQIKGRPPRGSFTLPDDAVRALGPDPHTAGMVLAGMFGLAPATEGDDPRIIDPDVVKHIGHGDLAKGRKVLERFIQMVRRQGAPQHIEQPDGNSPSRVIR